MPFDLAAFMADRPGHGGAIGLAFHGQGPDWAELALPWRVDLLGSDGELAPGAVLALMDVACAAAVWVRRDALIPQVTLDLRLDRLRAPARATVVGRAECHAIAGPVAFVRGAVHDGDPADPFARVVGSFMLLDAA